MHEIPFVESLSPHNKFVVNANFFKGLDAALNISCAKNMQYSNA